MWDDMRIIVIIVLAGAAGSVLGAILKTIRGERWRNSIRGMLFATAMIAVALYLLVSQWPK